jgi:hypothetical protein
VKRAFAWIAGLVGIAALGRWLARRRRPAQPPAAPDDPAGELRRRLDATRTPAPEVDDEPDDADARTLEERRADVHVKAQEAIDAMRESGL